MNDSSDSAAQNETILVLNAGSSSIKFALFGSAAADGKLALCFHGQIEGIAGDAPRFRANRADGVMLADQAPTQGRALDHAGALAILFAWLDEHAATGSLAAVGHRVVHGGQRFHAPLRIDSAALAELEALAPLAPLHQPHNLAPIRALLASRPELPQVACFDTAFHHSQPALARLFALPHDLSDAGVQRYGFHGLSYEYIASVLPAIAGADIASGRVVIAHLGNGASLCALREGKSVATTMGFTALDGLPMGTRCGALDPGVLLYLMAVKGWDGAALTDLLYHRSGLLGVSGLSHDMRVLLASADPRAQQAIDLFVYRIGRELGSLAAALGGLDALVFTGGIGEHAAAIRARVCRAAAWLGVALDDAANERGGPRISDPRGAASAWVIPTDEERVIARHVHTLLHSPH